MKVDNAAFSGDSKKLLYGFLGDPVDETAPKSVTFKVLDLEHEDEKYIPLKGYEVRIRKMNLRSWLVY